MRVGITGHQELPEPSHWSWVRSQIGKALDSAPSPLVGISSLAKGADQVFAESVIERGGTLEAVVPFPQYEARFASGPARENYQNLLATALRTTVLQCVGSDEECYYAAGKCIVDSCETLLAVWNGKPAKGLGGTADIVAYAKTVGRQTIHIDPATLSVVSLERNARTLPEAW